MKIIRLLKYLLMDEVGIDPITASMLIGGAGKMLGAFGKPKTTTVDPYAQLRGKTTDYLGGKLGSQTPYERNPAFDVPKPAVESEVEKGILGKLQRPPGSTKDIMDISGKYYDARKAQMEARHEEEISDTRAMYNRLGLVSSTPGLEGVEEKREYQGREFDTLEAELMQDSINKEIQALTTGEDIYNRYLGQGQVLGQAQRGYDQYSQGMSMEDIKRMTSEGLSYDSLITQLLSSNPPQQYSEPGIMQKIGGGISDTASTYGLMKMLGEGTTKKKEE